MEILRLKILESKEKLWTGGKVVASLCGIWLEMPLEVRTAMELKIFAKG